MKFSEFRVARARPRSGPASAFLFSLAATLYCGAGFAPQAGAAPAVEGVRLGGHVTPVPSAAASKSSSADAGSLRQTLTIVLRRDDEAGFEAYLSDVYDASSPRFRAFLTPREVSDRFGPSESDYAGVKSYFAGRGFAITADSANRMTLSVEGTRATIESSLGVLIKDYAIDDSGGGEMRRFAANTNEPMLPAELAPKVQSIVGLSTLAQVRRVSDARRDDPTALPLSSAISQAFNAAVKWVGEHTPAVPELNAASGGGGQSSGSNGSSSGGGHRPQGGDGGWIGIDGSGQTIGLVEFDTFQMSDVADFLALVNFPPSQLEHVTRVPVGGGALSGANASESLLDITFVAEAAPGADIAVYETTFNGAGSFQSLFNRMINDGVDIISSSWAYCEDQTTLADMQSLESILATAAASGITVLAASGDTGSTCLDGSANTVSVPSGAPHVTSVGGSAQTFAPGWLYLSETWWDGSTTTPRTGQGGFGTSRFFARPTYQNGFTSAAMRSVPDLVTNADPFNGVQFCETSNGGCPSPLLWGGTSMTAPAWAAYTALLNQALGTPLGFLNPQLYPLSTTSGFHSPASMASDFAHVGLGSPNVNALYVALSGAALGPADASLSTVYRYARSEDAMTLAYAGGLSADATTPAYVVVILRDGNGNTVPGKTVTLSANAGSHALISPASAVTTVANGAALFTITDSTIEDLTFTAVDVTDGVTIGMQAGVSFVAPPAASAGIMAFPTTVAANGVDASSITITLRDADNHPTPGKEIALAQNGRSIAIGPNPSVTDANGEIVFTATDAFEETVTYTAVDVTDGNLPIPGNAVVTFSGSAAGSCVVPPTAGEGYELTPFANGFAAYPFFYGNTNFGCSGVNDPTFDTNGDAYVVHFPTGALYKFGPDGGSATTPFSTNLGPTMRAPVFGRDGRIYAPHSVTTGDFFTGDIVELDPVTGTVVRQVASSLTCPGNLAVDPLSGDLFFTDACFGAGSDNPALFRVTDPGDTDPDRPTAVVTYATLPRTPNGNVAFAPNGTMYVESGYLDPVPVVVKVTGTDQPQPATYETVADVPSIYWINVGATLPDGSARSLIVLQYPPGGGSGTDLNLVDITTSPPTVTTLAHNIGSGTIGPDGCLYTSVPDTIYKLTPLTGPCDFSATNPAPALALTPRAVAPSPAQGTTQTFTATFSNLAVPANTPVYFRVFGANAQFGLARTDANGAATFDYQGVFAGGDVVTAEATVGDATLTSNAARVTFAEGPHATFIGFMGTGGAVAGQPTTLKASLVDIAVDPQVPIAGASVHFSVGGQSCNGTTDANGVASCAVTVSTPGAYTLTATYAGTSQYLPASASTAFVIPTDGIDLIFADGFDGN